MAKLTLSLIGINYVNILKPSSKALNLDVVNLAGDLVIANVSISDIQYLQESNDIEFADYIKKQLCTALVEHLLKESKHVLFTKHQHQNEGITTFIARMTVVPKDSTQEFVKSVKQFQSI